MSLNNRSDFINAAASDKIILAHIHANKRIINWTNHSGNIYKRTLPFFVNAIKNGLTPLTQVSDLGSVVAGTYFYEITSKTVYIELSDSSNPVNSEMIVNYRLFFSNKSLTTSWDLEDTGEDVYYDGRIIRNPEYNHQIGLEQNLASIVGKGTLQLTNIDGELDDIYDTLIFENQDVFIYNWNDQIPISDKQIIYRGKVAEKFFDNDAMQITVKDQLYSLLAKVPQTTFTQADNVNESIYGKIKRWVYGRVDGMQLQSVDQIGEGYQITGTVTLATPIRQVTRFSSFQPASFYPNSGTGFHFKVNKAKDSRKYVYWYNKDGNNTQPVLGDEFTYIQISIAAGDNADAVSEKTSVKLATNFDIIDGLGFFKIQNIDPGKTTASTAENSGMTFLTEQVGVNPESVNGLGTNFLDELSPGDTLLVDTLEMEIESIESDVLLNLTDVPEYNFNGLTAKVNPEIPTTAKNREYFVAGHACAELTKTVASVIQFNRLQLNDTTGLKSGDFVEIVASGERIEIKTVAPNNIVVLRQNMINLPLVGSQVIRRPIQKLLIKGQSVPSTKFTIANTSTDTKITFTDDVEFDLAKAKQLGIELTFTNGSRTLTTTSDLDLTQFLKSRDWIRPADLAYTTYYEILDVTAQTVTLRTVFNEVTISDTATYKSPDYLSDDAIVSANVLGRTVDNTPSGTWLQTGSDCVKDILSHLNITNIDTTSFTNASVDAKHLISLTLPLNFNDDYIPAKRVVDLINKSINGTLTLNNDLDLQYRILLVNSADDLPIIKDSDVINYKVRATNGKTYKTSVAQYRHQDIVPATLVNGFNVAEYDSDFVEKYIGTDDINRFDVYLYDQLSAEIMSHRNVYYNQLSRSQITIESDLRLENLVIGDVVILDFDRLYKRYGGSPTRKKMVFIVGKKVTGEKITFITSDLSNTFNQSFIIAPNDTPDYTSATDEQRLKYGFITDSNGIVDNDEDTANTNLIT